MVRRLACRAEQVKSTQDCISGSYMRRLSLLQDISHVSRYSVTSRRGVFDFHPSTQQRQANSHLQRYAAHAVDFEIDNSTVTRHPARQDRVNRSFALRKRPLAAAHSF